MSSPAPVSPLEPVYQTGSVAVHGNHGPAVVLAERRPGAMINVQGEAGSAAFLDAVKHGFGIALPQEPNSSAIVGASAAHWLGPNSWLIVGPAIAPDELRRRHQAITAAAGALIDVSSGRVVLRVVGPKAADVMAKNCGLDFHVRRFAVSRCAQSLYGRVAVLIAKFDSAPGFDLFAARSYAGSLWHEVAHAAAEFGYRVDPPVPS